MGQGELNILEDTGIIVCSVSPWASPIVVVPKRSARGEPPKQRLCIDYWLEQTTSSSAKRIFQW